MQARRNKTDRPASHVPRRTSQNTKPVKKVEIDVSAKKREDVLRKMEGKKLKAERNWQQKEAQKTGSVSSHGRARQEAGSGKRKKETSTDFSSGVRTPSQNNDFERVTGHGSRITDNDLLSPARSKEQKIPTVAIVGRANVGKSRLWNRMSETSQALVSSIPHTTRDRNFATCLWRGRVFQIVDTGGMDADTDTVIGRGIVRQAELAIRQADLALFLIDAQTGILPQDIEFVATLKRLNPHAMLVANKSDRTSSLGEGSSSAVWKLNLGEPIPVSAANGRGIGDLLDLIYEDLESRNRPPIEPPEKPSLKIVLMGRPNVGKSSIMNAILGEERSIVSPVAHTTREPVDTDLVWHGQPVTLVDTAGMRRRARIEEKMEFDAMDRNRQALQRADVAVLVLDANEDPRKQDKHLAGLLKESNRGLIIAVNKWDTVPHKTTGTSEKFAETIRQSLPFLAWAPIVFVSADQHQRVDDILNIAFNIREERGRRIQTNALEKFLKFVIAKQPPRALTGPKKPYIAHAEQTGSHPPRFLLTLKGAGMNLHSAWLKFFERMLREKFGFQGTPIAIDTEVDTTPVEKTFKGPHRRKRPMGRRVGRY